MSRSVERTWKGSLSQALQRSLRLRPINLNSEKRDRHLGEQDVEVAIAEARPKFGST